MLQNGMPLSKIKNLQEQKEQSQKRNLIVLILEYLRQIGYVETFEMLKHESRIDLNRFAAADNIDLLLVIQEFENYYNIKHGKPPKLVRVVEDQVKRHSSNVNLSPRTDRKPKIEPKSLKRLAAKTEEAQKAVVDEVSNILDVKGVSVSQGSDRAADDYKEQQLEECSYPEKSEALLGTMANHAEKELTSLISRDILVKNPGITWNDVCGLERSKKLLKEATVYPLLFPKLFTGLLSPWKGILLFGPPGTGKTMLAKAVATECQTTFFNVSAASIVSKWRGDSEKLVKILFEMARRLAPTIIFIDEIESIMGTRASEGEHEGSRRMKTELLIQMDGLNKSEEHICLLAASNLPWEIDSAMLRRFEKRILIGLPDELARENMFQMYLPPSDEDSSGFTVSNLDYSLLAKRTEGSDIHLVCKEAAMRAVRRILLKYDMDSTKQAPLTQAEPLEMEDMEEALSTTHPSCVQSMHEKYNEWQRQYGSI